jgi:hypothetical protein
MANDNPIHLQRRFARAYKKLHAQMGREEMRKFCSAISKNKKFLNGKSQLRLHIDPGSKEAGDSLSEQRARKRKREQDKIERLDTVAQNFKKNAVSNVKSLVKGHWYELSGVSSEIISCQPESDQRIRLLRLNQHLALLKETRHDQIRWMWKGIKLTQHLRSYEAFLDESGYTQEKERNSQRARDQYFRYLYKGWKLDETKEKEARTGLTEHLRYGRRWKIFLDALTTGFIIVCGLNFAMKVM